MRDILKNPDKYETINIKSKIYEQQNKKLCAELVSDIKKYTSEGEKNTVINLKNKLRDIIDNSPINKALVNHPLFIK
jgi:polyhydroxyalkanoate synthesis regulator phasin